MAAVDEVRQAAGVATDDLVPGAIAFAEAWARQYGVPYEMHARVDELAAAYEAGYRACETGALR